MSTDTKGLYSIASGLEHHLVIQPTFVFAGPAVVTTDEVGDPHNLGIRCTVNGVTKQDSSTAQLVFNTQQIVAWCSKFFTLLPGDVILTGTPPGVGVFMKPPQFLKVTEQKL